MAYLCTELIDAIVGLIFSSGDRTALQACALIARSWHRVARRYILREITVRNVEAVERLEALLNNDAAAGRFILELKIHLDVMQTSWITRLPAILSPLAMNLRCIKVQQLYEFGQHCNEAFFIGLSALINVSTLILEDSVLTFPIIYAFASALPSLRHLHIRAISPFPGLGPDPPQLYVPRLESLHLTIEYRYSEATVTILDWILSTPSRETLRSASIEARASNSACVANFLATLGPRLEVLSLGLVQIINPRIESNVIVNDISLAQYGAGVTHTP